MRIAVLASGSGTILHSILGAGIPVALVVTDRHCGALDIAAEHGVPATLVERPSYGDDFDRDAFSTQVAELLEASRIDLVAMAGWGTIFSTPMFIAFDGRIINTHPALLPAFKGWHAVREALSAGVKVTGCTVHVATPEVDHGPILAQEAVRVEPGDTEESLHERIKVVERRLYVETLARIIETETIT